MIRILLVEDEAAIAASLKEYLNKEGYSVSCAASRKEAMQLLACESFNLALLDVTLPDGTGYTICSQAKAQKVPVIFLTASGDENSVVRGLEMGADDYVPKPFRPRELLARIRNVLRKYRDNETLIAVGNIFVDTQKGIVLKNPSMNTTEETGDEGRDAVLVSQLEEIPVSALEYKLLNVFLNNRGRLLTRDTLLEEIWDIAGDYVNDNTLTVYIKRLREKIEQDPQNPQIIKTVRGMGYRLD